MMKKRPHPWYRIDCCHCGTVIWEGVELPHPPAAWSDYIAHLRAEQSRQTSTDACSRRAHRRWPSRLLVPSRRRLDGRRLEMRP